MTLECKQSNSNCHEPNVNTSNPDNGYEALHGKLTSREFTTLVERIKRLKVGVSPDLLVDALANLNSIPQEQRYPDLALDTFEDRLRVYRAILSLPLDEAEKHVMPLLLILSQLGRCPVCTDVFLRKRKDQKCCCKKCSNVYRVRKWRENKQRYYLQRYEHAESMEKEKPHVVPERKRKDLVVSLPLRGKDRSRIQPKPEPDRSAGSRKAKASPA